MTLHPAVLDGLAAGRIGLFRTWMLCPAGLSAPAAGRLPVAVRPRQDAPAAHDLFVDTLAGRGRRVETVVVPDERAGLALVAAGQAVLFTADRTLAAAGVEPREAPIRRCRYGCGWSGTPGARPPRRSRRSRTC